MKNSIRSVVVVVGLTLSLTVGSVMQPRSAHAGLSWMFSDTKASFSMLLMGALITTSGMVQQSIALQELIEHRRAQYFLGFASVVFVSVGTFFLADESASLGLQKLDERQVKFLNLTDNERDAYNNAVDVGVFEQLFQQASQDLGQDSSMEDLTQLVSDLMIELSPDARSALTKVAQSLLLDLDKAN